MRCARFATAERGCAALLLGLALGCSQAPVEQPMGFSHKRHMEADLDCTTCHETVADAPAATIPPLRVCSKCHKELQGKDPDEPKILEYVQKKQEVPWVQVNKVAGHVYFSHRPHVGFAEMECDVCHGDMKSLEEPLRASNTDHLTMRACMSCHARKGASNDCVACHK